MPWNIISRTMHSIIAIGGLMMEIIGIYFDATQAAGTPSGPLGLSFLAWGAMLVTVIAVSVIAQLWWHVHKLESSYQYALKVVGLKDVLNNKGLQIAVSLSNTMQQPIQYWIDTDNIKLVLGDSALQAANYANNGVVLSGQNPEDFRIPAISMPNTIPCEGCLSFKLVYGSPGTPMFRRDCAWKLELAYIGGSLENPGTIQLSYFPTLARDTKIKKRELDKEAFRI